MHLRGITVGALNMFRTATGSLSEEDVLVAQALADVATIAIIQHQASVSAAVLNSQLSEALNSRIIIEQAKGKISEASGLDMDRSFQRIRNHARNHNLRLTELARGIAEGTTSIVGLDPLPRQPGMRAISSNPWPGPGKPAT
jgi:GAF domain-containing protein